MFKKLLKEIGLPDSISSIILGFLVVVVGGLLIYNYISPQNYNLTSEKSEDINNIATDKDTLPKIHKVENGQNLWTIAEMYYGSGYNWVDIAKENKLSNPDKLLTDTELIIPKVEVAKTNDISSASVEMITYTVKPGDNLWNIALNQLGDGYAWSKIAKQNNLSNPDIIHAGNILKINK
jgi:nucleoid-associated protein YgaU